MWFYIFLLPQLWQTEHYEDVLLFRKSPEKLKRSGKMNRPNIGERQQAFSIADTYIKRPKNPTYHH